MNDEAQTYEFEEVEQPDIRVAETFVNSYGDKRAVLKGDTYNAKETIKFDWDTTHHDFDESRSAWVVDADSLDILATKLQSDGYTVALTDEDEAIEDGFPEMCGNLNDGAAIAVTYQMKNGNGTKTIRGVVKNAKKLHDGRDTGVILQTEQDGRSSKVVFVDEDGKTKWLKRGKYDQPALFCDSQYPFMGSLESVEIIAEGDA